MGIALQPENENPSTRDLYKDQHVIIPAQQKSHFYLHSVGIYKGLWSQICGSVELLLLETKKIWLFSPYMVLNTEGKSQNQTTLQTNKKTHHFKKKKKRTKKKEKFDLSLLSELIG